MKKPLLAITLGLVGISQALTVVNTTPPNDRANVSPQAGQTFTTPVLGADNKLDTVTVITASDLPAGSPTGPFTLKVFTDTDGNFSTWDPGVQVAASTNTASLTPAGNVQVTFNFSGEVLADNTVYVLSFNNGTNDHAGFRAGLTNTSGVAITNGALFSGGAQPFSGAYDMACIVVTNSGVAPKDIIWTAATDGNWNTSTSNWKLAGGSPATFNNGDSVTFDNNAASGSVTLVGSIEPADILVNNSSLGYTLGGAPLAGNATLTKQGVGTLTLTANHNYTGGTTLLQGSITAGNGATAGEIGRGAVRLDAGTTLTISRSDLLAYNTIPKLRILTGGGNLVINGGGLIFTYPGGGLGFNAADSWAGFSGDITVTNGSEWQSIRNGATGHGTGTIVLGDATTNGSLSQIEGNWTWTNPIQTVGPDNRIINRSGPAFTRSLKLQGPISGAGNLTFQDATAGMNNPNDGFVITHAVTLSGTLTIDTATPLRIGGVPGEVNVAGTGLNADAFGSLGTTAVVNNGILTFSRTDAHTVASAISGSGDVRIGMPAAANRGDSSTQVVTFADSTKTYSGFTTVESGTLLVNGTLPNSFVDVNPEGTLGGTGTVALSTLVLGTISPGVSVGTLTFSDDLLFEAGSSYAVEISNFTGTAGSGYDTLNAAELVFEGTDATPITIVVKPSSVTNFSENPATFTLATSSQPITFIDLAGFTVNGSAFAAATGSAGTWDVQLSGDSRSLELVYTPGDPNSFANWINGFYPGETDPSIVGFNADPDGDGIGNAVENFLGTAPDQFNAAMTITSSTATSVTATHTRSNKSANDVSGSYQWSSDLASWNASGATDGRGVTATITAVVTDDQAAPLNDTVEVTATVTAGSSARLFLRIVASQTTP
jgi:autotransporter-associated beta strand protein